MFIPKTLKNSEWAYESKSSVKCYKLTHDTFIERWLIAAPTKLLSVRIQMVSQLAIGKDGRCTI